MSIDRSVAPTRKVHWAGVALCALACVSACASAKRSDTRAEAPAFKAATHADPPPGAQSSHVDSNGSGAAPTAPPAAAPPAAPETPSREGALGPGAAAPHSPGGNARNRFVQARRELDIATGERDCARACRALESMERASNQVCELARSKEDRQACESTREQVDSARTQVQSACGDCSGKPR